MLPLPSRAPGASELGPGRGEKDPDARDPEVPGVLDDPLPYLLLRRWQRRLLGPAVLSWFRATGREHCGRSARVGRTRAGAALGAGRPGSGCRGKGWQGGAPAPPLGCWENGDSGSRLAFFQRTACHFTNPLATCPRKASSSLLYMRGN